MTNLAHQRYSIALVTAPTAEPVTRQEVKDHLRIDSDLEDTHLDLLIKAARQHCENAIHRAFVTQTWRLKLDHVPCGTTITFPNPPLLTVSSFAYVDTSGSSTTWSSTNYTVAADADPGRLMLAYNASWPAVRTQPEAITITYTAGYGAASAVPQTLKHAVKMLVAHWYENREPVLTGSIVADMPMSVDALLAGESWGSYS